jgi:uncharacterized protein YkwD
VKYDTINNSNYNIDSTEHEKLLNETILDVNTFRKNNGLGELVYDPGKQNIAQEYANYCAINNWKIGHYDKNGNGLKTRTTNAGYYGIAKENLYFGT